MFTNSSNEIFRDCFSEDWDFARRETSPSLWSWLKSLFRR